MNPLKEYSKSPIGSSILLSIKPKYSELILAGSKKVELRRSIPNQPIRSIAIYSSAPTQAIVALVNVIEIIEANRTQLWEIAKNNGGGLTREELRSYYVGKSTGFAIMLGKVRAFEKPIDPGTVFYNFTPPQSFRYLSDSELKELEDFLDKRKK